MFKILEEIEKLLNKKEITRYRIEINTVNKMYLLDKPEQEKQNTNAIGFSIPNRNEHEG